MTTPPLSDDAELEALFAQARAIDAMPGEAGAGHAVAVAAALEDLAELAHQGEIAWSDVTLERALAYAAMPHAPAGDAS